MRRKIFCCDITKLNKDDLVFADAEIDIFSHSIDDGIEGIGRLLQASDIELLSEGDIKSIGSILSTLGFFSNLMRTNKEIVCRSLLKK